MPVPGFFQDGLQHLSVGFVGREDELDAISGALARPPAIVLVEGEAGIGKTRVVREVLTRTGMRAKRTLTGRCYPLREPFTLGPVVEALEEAARLAPRRPLSAVAGALRPLLPESASALPPAPDRLDDAPAERHRVFRAARELLDAHGPVLLVLEDAHWADDATADFLTFVANSWPPSLSVVLTYRAHDLSPRAAIAEALSRLQRHALTQRVALAPLTEVEVGQLVAAILGIDSVSAELSAYLTAQTSGVPFVVEETVRLLQDREDLVQRDGTWVRRTIERLHVPHAVRDSVLERAARLTSPARSVLDAAAVLEMPAEAAVIAAVAGMDASGAAGALGEALAAALLEPHELGYAFRHVLARLALYEAIPEPARRQLHARAAAALQGGRIPRAAQLAHHHHLAGNLAAWTQYAEQAADLALRVGDDHSAAVLLEELLASGHLAEADRVRLAVKLGSAALHGFRHDRAVTVLRRILEEETMATSVRGELRLSLGLLLHQAGRSGEAAVELRACIPELDDRPELQARAMSSLALPAFAEGAVEDNLSWLDRALAVVARHDDPELLAAVLVDHAFALLCLADARAWPALERIPAPDASVGQRRQLVRGHRNIAVAALFLGHYAQAERHLAQGLHLSVEMDYERHRTALELIQLLLAWATGETEGLAARLAQLCRGEQAAAVLDGAELLHGWLALAAGDIDQAELRLTASTAHAQATGETEVLLSATGALATAARARGDVTAAHRRAKEAFQVLEETGLWVWAGDVAVPTVDALVAAADVATARRFVDELTARLADKDAPAAAAALVHCQGALLLASGDTHAAAERFAVAQRSWEALPSPLQAARSQAALGSCLLDSGDSAGVKALRGALGAFASLGAVLEHNRVAAELRRLNSTQQTDETNVYSEQSATSAAAAHVAGIAAQLYQMDAGLTPSDVENLLEDTAHQFAAGEAYKTDAFNRDTKSSPDKGHGLVDALAAARAVAFPLQLLAPGPDADVSGLVVVHGSATYGDRVVITVDGDAIGVAEGAHPRWFFELDASSLSPGPHMLGVSLFSRGRAIRTEERPFTVAG